jgi:sugar O-acyltransferase (sialic acid O-acetyltransferase NeuD family)
MERNKIKKCVIFGNGMMASMAHFYLKHDSPYEVVSFAVDSEHVREERFEQKPVVSFETIQDVFPADQYVMFVPISYKNMNQVRAKKYYEAKDKGYHLISYVSSKVTKWPGLKVGDNCFIFENNVLQPFVEIGSNTILWSGNHIGHHSKIGEHCFLASHIVVSGRVTIEPHCFLGVNATLRDGITISEKTLIGAGVTILKNTQPGEVYASQATQPLPITSDKIKRI